jgi:hypothetical protein
MHVFARMYRDATNSMMYVHQEYNDEVADDEIAEHLEELYPGFIVLRWSDTPEEDWRFLLFVDDKQPGTVYFGDIYSFRRCANQGGMPRVFGDHRYINFNPCTGEMLPVLVQEGPTACVESWPLKVAPKKWGNP